jgi:hypothetical protein
MSDRPEQMGEIEPIMGCWKVEAYFDLDSPMRM